MEINVVSSLKTYPIYMYRGCLHHVNKYVGCRKALVITEDNIPKEYLEAIVGNCSNIHTLVLESGEHTKSLQSYAKCIDRLLDLNFNRSDLIVALGGGVIGDLAGYVASTYMRGIEFINVPTTTLSQIDSSIGGKVAINHHGVKNCIGSFYPPQAVFIDVDVLATLDERNYNNGLIEALKAGLIGDEILYYYFKNNNVKDNIEDVILRSLLVKKHIVEIDEFEKNQRKTLNLGHTLGHGFESMGNFEALLHGESVAYGMIAMIDNLEIKNEVIEIINKLNLPPLFKMDKDILMSYIKNDKKGQNQFIDIIVVNNIKDCVIKSVSYSELEDILEGAYGEYLG